MLPRVDAQRRELLVTTAIRHMLEGEIAKRAFYILRHKERHVSKAEAALLSSIAGAK